MTEPDPRRGLPVCILAATPEMADLLAGRLGLTGRSRVLRLCRDPDDLPEEDARRGLVMGWGRAGEAVAGALARSADPKAALDDWIATVRDLVQLLRRDRARVLAVEVAALEGAALADVARRAQKTFGLRLRPPAELSTPRDPSPTGLQRLIGMSLVAASKQAQALEAELEASTPVALRRPVAGKAELAAVASTDLREMQAERQRDRARIREQADKNETSAARIAELMAEVAAAREDVARIQARLTQSEARAESSEARAMESLAEARGRTAQAEDARAEAETRLRGAWRTVEARDQTIQALQGEISALHNSTSWRVTRPIRAVRRIFGRGPGVVGADGKD